MGMPFVWFVRLSVTLFVRSIFPKSFNLMSLSWAKVSGLLRRCENGRVQLKVKVMLKGHMPEPPI